MQLNLTLPEDEQISMEDAMTRVGAKRYCCRRDLMNPPVMPAGLFVDDEIEQLQTLMKKVEFTPSAAPRTVRVYSTTLGETPSSGKMRRPLTYDEIVSNLRNVQVSDETIAQMMQEKGITRETAYRYNFFIKRDGGRPDFEALSR